MEGMGKDPWLANKIGKDYADAVYHLTKDKMIDKLKREILHLRLTMQLMADYLGPQYQEFLKAHEILKAVGGLGDG